MREAAVKYGVSIRTVRDAWELLERNGLLECRPKSGYFVRSFALARPVHRERPLHEYKPGDTDFCRLYGDFIAQNSRSRIANLAIATPDHELLPGKVLAGIAADCARLHCDRMMDYTMAPGLRSLREGIARVCQGAGFNPEVGDIVVTNGCTEALALALQTVCSKGDTIAVESPLYFNFLQSAAFMDLNLIEIPSSQQTGINLDVLDYILETKTITACIVIPTWSNPTGSLMPVEHKKRLVALMAAKGVTLIEDDINGDLGREIPRPPACYAFAAGDADVIYVSSFSKTLGGGLRTGWIISPRRTEDLIKRKTLFSTANSSLDQMIVSRFLEDKGYERHVRALRGSLAERMAENRALILETFPEGTEVTDPKGGFLLWITLPHDLDASLLYQDALLEGILFPPGELFSASKRFRSSLRLNASCTSPEARAAIRRLGSLAKKLPDVP